MNTAPEQLLKTGSYGADENLRKKHNIALSRDNMSKAEIVARLPMDDQDAFLKSLSPAELDLLLTDWSFWGRPKQLVPIGDWFVWLIMAGRGFGKTRCGAEAIRGWQEQGYSRFALIGQNSADVRDVMLFGDSGLITISPKHNKPVHIASRRLIEWPNGAVAHLYSGDEPDQLRGPQHEKGWADEIAKYKYLDECLDMFELGLRLGNKPQYVATTTPKPKPALKKMIKDPSTIITTGSSFENLSNLAAVFVDRVIRKYEGTRLGRQELYAVLFEDVAGALWNHNVIDRNRVMVAPDLIRIVVAIDPSTTCNARSDEAGIVVVGLGANGHVYVLRDSSMKAHPNIWAANAVHLYKEFMADLIVGEANNGGDLVEIVIRIYGPNVNYQKVHAARGKHTRAEPVAALYEKNVVHHVGEFTELETELVEWVPGEESPNRLDALVWGISALMFDDDSPGELRAIDRFM